MGRYYSGDIEGKFWFGVQSSDDASFFGGEQQEPNYIEFVFSKDEDLPTIKKGIARCKKELGDYKKGLDDFFKTEGATGYNDDMLVKYFKKDIKEIYIKLEWYARLELGQKILKCVKEKDYCQFQAEL